MTFRELAEYLGKLEGTSSRNEMTVTLAELFSKTTPEEARLVAYLSQGHLGPAYRTPDFGVGDKQVIKAMKRLSDKDVDALFKSMGDLGLVAEKINSDVKVKDWQIGEVYKKLWEVASANGTGSQEGKQKLIGEVLVGLDPGSAKYVVKMILGKLRTGFSDMTVLDALSWMAAGDKSLRPHIEQMYNVRTDLGEIAEIVKQAKDSQEIKRLSVEPKMGTPILMARAERAKSAGDIWERNGEGAVEHKLDGLRMQAHVDKKGVSLFSRGLENVTKMYPDVAEGLAKQVRPGSIVEGEMIAVAANGKYMAFQETVQRKRKYDIAEMTGKVPLKIFLFDVLVTGNKNVMHEANSARRKTLEEIVDVSGGKTETVQLMPRIIAKSVKEIEDYFSEALNEGTEGIVAKRLDGPYQAGARDFNWIKYKKSYDKSTLADTVDAVVMGYDVGQGKRSGFGIGDFLIGVYDKKTEQYQTIAKIGTGLTDDEWREMKAQCSMLNVQKKPENYIVTKQMECDHWVKPKIVVEVKADEITKSPMHSSGFALRFPRLVNWRDKKPEDATTAAEIRKLAEMQKQ